MKKVVAATMMTASLAGVGASAIASAPSANATGWSYSTYRSGHYGSYNMCQASRGAVINSVSTSFRAHTSIKNPFVYIGKCSYSYSGHYWTYGHITTL